MAANFVFDAAGRRLLNYDARPFVPAGGPALASVTETGKLDLSWMTLQFGTNFHQH